MLTVKLEAPNKRQNLPQVPVMAIITKETTQVSRVEINAKSSMKTPVTTTTSSIILKRRAKTNLKVKVHVLIMFPTPLQFPAMKLIFQKSSILN